MGSFDCGSQQWIELAAAGDLDAATHLLGRYRDRLKRMVRLHLDRRLAARVDPSDVVQEAMAEAARRISEYLNSPSVPIYIWVRQITWQRLCDLHVQHIQAQKRSVNREQSRLLEFNDESSQQLADRLAANSDGPLTGLLRREVQRRVRTALNRLAPNNQELLGLRYLEGLELSEVAAVLGISLSAVRSRHRRAIGRLRLVLEQVGGCDGSSG